MVAIAPPWILPSAAAFVCWGLWAVLQKPATGFLHASSVLVYQGATSAVFALLVFVIAPSLGFAIQTVPQGIALSVMAAFFGSAGTLAFLFAVTEGPASVIVPLTSLYPVLAALLGFAFLHEPITATRVAGIAAAALAIWLLTR